MRSLTSQLFRPFLRITYSSEQLTLALPIKYWNRMSDWATKAIEWAAVESNSWVLESIGMYLYSWFICVRATLCGRPTADVSQSLVCVRRRCSFVS